MTFHNRTRTSPSIRKRLIRERRYHLLPLYGLLRLSTLGREGIEHGGSYRFADHIYRNRASGRFGIGWLVDRTVLSLPSTAAFRARYTEAKHIIIERGRTLERPVRVLATPAGYAREVYEAAAQVPVSATFLDLDDELLQTMRSNEAYHGLDTTFVHADALDPRSYEQLGTYDVIVCLGLFEFISDKDTVRLMLSVQNCMDKSSVFVCSGMRRHAISDYLLRTLAELHTNYRDETHLRALAQTAGLTRISTTKDRTGIQTVLSASLS